jgi:phytoene desaturase
VQKAIVIGAGIAGIASAIRLKAKGYDVEVLEANAYAGGKLSQREASGYRFDAGPSLFTQPQLVEELFALLGENTKDWFEYERLADICHYFWDNGAQITAWADLPRFAKELETKFEVPSKTTLNFLANTQQNYETLEPLFLENSLHSWRTWLGSKAWKGYLRLHKLGLFTTMAKANEATFKHPKVVQLFNRYATYNGSDAYQTPATLNIIPHLEYNLGAYFPKKGMVSITNSLVALAQRHGVRFSYHTKVSQIETEGSKVTAVFTTDGQRFEADVVASNSDVSATYQKLLPQAKQPSKLLAQPKSSSGVVFYWGINRQFPELGLHNIFFSEDYKAEFAEIFSQNTPPTDPTVYINITSKHLPSDAPEGHENWFVLINVPPNNAHNWPQLIEKLRKAVIQKVGKRLGVDLEKHIVFEDILDPILIEQRTSSSQGALYGNSSNNKFAAFLRHPNFSKQYSNLYFVGGSVHPGGGIPLALASAKIATSFVK